MNKIYTAVTTIVLFLLFTGLFYVGIINLAFRNILKTRFHTLLDFGSNYRTIGIFYLAVVIILFIVILAIMVRLFTSYMEEKTPPPLPDELFTAQEEEELEKEPDSGFFQDFRKSYLENQEELLGASRIDEFKERVDELYVNLSQIVTDILSARSYSELFEKTLFWAQNISKSEKGSIMLPENGNQLYIYKITGRDMSETRRLKQTKLSRETTISGQVFRNKKKFHVENLDFNSSFEYPYKTQYKTSSFVSIPIMINTNVIAILNLTDTLHTHYTLGDMEAINLIVKVSSGMFEVLHLRKQMKD